MAATEANIVARDGDDVCVGAAVNQRSSARGVKSEVRAVEVGVTGQSRCGVWWSAIVIWGCLCLPISGVPRDCARGARAAVPAVECLSGARRF